MSFNYKDSHNCRIICKYLFDQEQSEMSDDLPSKKEISLLEAINQVKAKYIAFNGKLYENKGIWSILSFYKDKLFINNTQNVIHTSLNNLRTKMLRCLASKEEKSVYDIFKLIVLGKKYNEFIASEFVNLLSELNFYVENQIEFDKLSNHEKKAIKRAIQLSKTQKKDSSFKEKCDKLTRELLQLSPNLSVNVDYKIKEIGEIWSKQMSEEVDTNRIVKVILKYYHEKNHP